jgi:hypothetical protein
MLTIHEMQTQAYATATSKGWHDRPMREPGIVGTFDDARDGFIVHHDRVLRSHALMHTELTETQEALEEGRLAMHFDTDEDADPTKPEGFVVEIADLCIRIGDTAQALDVSLRLRDIVEKHQPNATWLQSAEGMRPAHEIRQQQGCNQASRDLCVVLWLSKTRMLLDKASEAARVDAWEEYANQLTCVLLHAASICAGLGLDLNAAIEAKMAYNKTRPHRHGGKQA